MQPELLFLDGDSRKCWPRELRSIGVFGPYLGIAVPWHALLFPVAANVWPCLVVHSSSFCFLQESLIVTESQGLFFELISFTS